VSTAVSLKLLSLGAFFAVVSSLPVDDDVVVAVAALVPPSSAYRLMLADP
jgi:hypothetical protein